MLKLVPYKTPRSTQEPTGQSQSRWKCPFLPHKTIPRINEQNQACWFIFRYLSPPYLQNNTPNKRKNWHVESGLQFPTHRHPSTRPNNILNLWTKFHWLSSSDRVASYTLHLSRITTFNSSRMFKIYYQRSILSPELPVTNFFFPCKATRWLWRQLKA